MISLNEEIITRKMVEKEIGWNDLAIITGLSDKTIRNARQDITTATIKTLLLIAETLDLTVKEILHEI